MIADIASAPEWYKLALADTGVREIPGPDAEPMILAYARDARLSWEIRSDEIPWCAVFVNAMLERTGIKGTREATAASFLKWGVHAYGPVIGAVIVLQAGSSHHVGFFAGFTDDGRYVKVLGGNQGNSVKMSNFPRQCIVDVRLPDNKLVMPADAPSVFTRERPIVPPNPFEVEEHLRDAGSRTIKNTDMAALITKAGIGSLTGLGLAKELSGWIAEVMPVMATAHQFLSFGAEHYWVVLAVIGGILMSNITNIVAARVSDHISGKNTGRP
jgi:uncharacterized protein (TIGR02594 family)